MSLALGVTLTAMAQDDRVVTEVGYLPENTVVEAVNLSTDISGDSFAALASRNTDQVLDRLVNINFVNADLENALRMIARQMDLNIIIGSGVRGKTISLDLRDVPLRFALDAILRANELGFVIERGGIVRVVSADEIMPEEYELQMLVRKLNWQIAAELEPVLEDFITDEGEIRADSATNSLIVNDVPARVEEIDALLNEIDTPERQVLIESRLVDITESGLRSLRSDFSISEIDTGSPARAPYNDLFLPAGAFGDGVGLNTPSLANPTMVWTAGTNWFGKDVAMRIEALEEESLARVLASPRVATINNVPANIEIVREVPYIETTFSPGGQTTQEVIFDREVGVELLVTPRITNNGYVRMNIQTRQEIQVDTVAIIGSETPVIARREAESNVITPDGGTAIVGGLRAIEDLESETGTPWFRQLPAIGFLFRGDDVSKDRIDYYAFISPTIIQDVQLNATDQYAYDLLDLEWNVPEDHWLEDFNIEKTY